MLNNLVISKKKNINHTSNVLPMNMSLSTKTSFIVWGAVLLFLSACGALNMKQHKTELELSLSINQDTFSLGDPIQCTFRLSNQSNIPIGIKNGLN